MSSKEIAVLVNGLGKMYRMYKRPQDRLLYAFTHRFGIRPGREFWALRDVSLKIGRGEAVGIIGRNGSGKSTLLQIMAGTLTPTTGEVKTSGQVAALLELGSSFNPDYTGRENVFFNGAILGLSQREMMRRFDEIAAFAGIGDFIDQPVKLYSSGMYVRLAFAVQAFVSANILIVDEAIAVGDAAFQMKCFRRLENLVDGGASVILVTHDLTMVKQYCRRAVLLDQGRLCAMGDPNSVVNQYMELIHGGNEQTAAPNRHRAVPAGERRHLYQDVNRFGQRKAEVVDLFVRNAQGDDVTSLASGESCVVTVRVKVQARLHRPVVGLRMKTITGVDAFAVNTAAENVPIGLREPGEELCVVFSQACHLGAGYYFLSAAVGEIVGDEYVAHDHRVDFFKLLITPVNKSAGIVNLSPSITVSNRG